jgi:hypothetical protein
MTKLYDIQKGSKVKLTIGKEGSDGSEWHEEMCTFHITEDYAKEMAKSLCTQLHGTLNPAYLKCDDYNHHDVQCACKEVYDETLNTHDGTLEKYLACKIYEFIEKI